MGWDPVVVTSAQHEPDVSAPIETISGTNYYRTPRLERTYPPVARELKMMSALRRRLTTAMSEQRPTVVHTHSPCHWGIVANAVARTMGIPSVYEIRSFWEDGIIDQGKDPRWSVKYKVTRRIENSVVNSASAVVTISGGLKQDLIDRGHDANRIFVVPNGVEPSNFKSVPSTIQRNSDAIRLAYIGSLYPWEGVDTLIEAMPLLRQKSPGITLEIVGDGIEYPRLVALARKLDLDSCVNFAGRVKHDEVREKYALADVCIYPRKSSRTTELVTPLKPLEALAMGKPVIASRVGGLTELLAGTEATFFEPGSSTDLARACLQLIAARTSWSDTGIKNADIVATKRSWSEVLGRYAEVYASVGSTPN